MIVAGIALGIALIALWLSLRSAFQVDEGCLGVVTYFGAAERDPKDPKKLRTRGPGLAWKYPWGKVVSVSMKEQNVELAGKDSGRMAMAEDGTVLRFDSILRYAPMASDLERFLFELKNPTGHITGLFTCLLRNEIANFRPTPTTGTPQALVDPQRTTFENQGGSYALIRRERDTLNRRIEQFARTMIGDRYGVQFSAVDLTDILPPDEIAEALNGVMHSKTDVDVGYFRAEGECMHRVVAAERGVDIAKSRARAVEMEIVTLCRYLEEVHDRGMLNEYVERRRTEVLSASKMLYVREAQ